MSLYTVRARGEQKFYSLFGLSMGLYTVKARREGNENPVVCSTWAFVQSGSGERDGDPKTRLG